MGIFCAKQKQLLDARMNAVAALAKKHASLGRALDVGCGPGLLCSLLANVGSEVNGAEISENMIHKARAVLSEYFDDVDGRLHHCPGW
jgi:2-polyprenyl-3-methyl-5-hydroxy-6-metoxy-1,4-benzoquinol methylase